MSNKKDGAIHEVFITKWWQSTGIVKARAYYDNVSPGRSYWHVQDEWARYDNLFSDGVDCFPDLESALTNVDKRVDKKVASLKKQLKNLDGFEPKQFDGCDKKTLDGKS